MRSLPSKLLVASQTTVLQQGTAKKLNNQLAPQLPTHVQCVQLTNLQTRKVVSLWSQCLKRTCRLYSRISSARMVGGLTSKSE